MEKRIHLQNSSPTENTSITPEVLGFLGGDPRRLALFEAVEAAIAALGPSEYQVSKSQIAWKNPLNFAFLSRPTRTGPDWPEGCLLLTFGLGYRKEHPRIFQAVEPYPNRWTHHVILTAPGEVDETIRTFLTESYAFSQAKRRGKRRAGE